MLTKKITFRAYIGQDKLSEVIYSLKGTDKFILMNKGNCYFLKKRIMQKSGSSFNFFNYKISCTNLKFKLQEIEISIYPKLFTKIFFPIMFLGAMFFLFNYKVVSGVLNMGFGAVLYYFSLRGAVEEIEEALIKRVK